MKTELSIKRVERQILALMGNQWVVFAHSTTLPHSSEFDPIRDSTPLPRVGGMADASENRIALSVQISGYKRDQTANDFRADVAFLTDATDQKLLVDIKIKDHDPRSRDIDASETLIRNAEAHGDKLEVWFFNRERLKLTVIYHELGRMHFEELFPLDVWERYEESVFKRQQVVDEVKSWERNLENLYNQITSWLGTTNKNLSFDKSRFVNMSEEMMQLFAVTDRELPILDVIVDEQAVISFVPRGLWIIGARGRVDIITRSKTRVLVGDTSSSIDDLQWLLISEGDRTKSEAFTKQSLVSLVEDV